MQAQQKTLTDAIAEATAEQIVEALFANWETGHDIPEQVLELLTQRLAA